jgi:predicted RNA-binding Zn ribbon-like protein
MDLLCLDFINSKWYETHQLFKDPLYSQKWMHSFCEKWKWKEIDVENIEDMKILIALRTFLSDAAFEFCKTRKLSKKTIFRLNKYLSPVSYQTLESVNDTFQLKRIPKKENTQWLAYQVALSFAELLTQSDIDRIKLCQNPDCGWIYYDQSHAGTRKWCDNTCASLMKVRNFRERQKEKNNEYHLQKK